MKDIREILDNYDEQPSEELWNRLEARLDAEMPVREARRTAWKWVAAAAGVLAVIGGVTFGVLRHQHHNETIAEVKGTEQTATAQTQEDVVETQNVAVSQEVESPSVVETQNVASPREEKSPVVVETRRGTFLQEEKPAVVVETSQGTSPQTETPKTKVRQEVLPPNSTLAKQLAADPVLRNLSEGDVEWAKPAHLSIPNLFTPNGDGVNDFFVIEGLEHYTSPKLVVRDKSNRIVYQSGSYQNKWDGGSCPDGIYSYEFTFTYNGIESQATGKVRIKRS